MVHLANDQFHCSQYLGELHGDIHGWRWLYGYLGTSYGDSKPIAFGANDFTCRSFGAVCWIFGHSDVLASHGKSLVHCTNDSDNFSEYSGKLYSKLYRWKRMYFVAFRGCERKLHHSSRFAVCTGIHSRYLRAGQLEHGECGWNGKLAAFCDDRNRSDRWKFDVLQQL